MINAMTKSNLDKEKEWEGRLPATDHSTGTRRSQFSLCCPGLIVKNEYAGFFFLISILLINT